MRNEIKLVPPCTYQGGKQRLSKEILDIIEKIEGNTFKLYDLCCGSGAVSLEAITRGKSVIMIDKGCFGLFWELLSKGEFDLEVFQEEISKLPDVSEIQGYLRNLSDEPVNLKLLVYHYLLLQAGAFGSKQIWIEGGEWKNNTFRSYWLPTSTSNRKSPVNPMMPMPKTLYERVKNLIQVPKGQLQGYHIDVFESVALLNKDIENAVVYIDPPYKNTTGYKERFEIEELIAKIPKGIPIYVSEGYKMEGVTESWLLSKGREKGNISGSVKKKPVEEWLNYFKNMDS